VPSPDPIDYVGEPSDEIDENWEILTGGEFAYYMSKLWLIIQVDIFSLPSKKRKIRGGMSMLNSGMKKVAGTKSGELPYHLEDSRPTENF
jgi:hypothetical protein